MYWIAFGTYDVAAHPRVAVLIDGVRAHGYRLAQLNEPLGLDTAARVRVLRQPWRLPRLAYRLLRSWPWLIRQARTLARTGPVPDVVLVGYLGHFDVLLARRLFPTSTIVLDHLVSAAGTAADRRVTGRVRQALLRALDRAALRRADVVVLDTEASRDQLPPPAPGDRPRRTVVCPVGATAPWFAACEEPTPSDTPGAPLRVIFFGLFTPLQGATVIAAAAALLVDEPGLEFTLVGHGQDHDAARALAKSARVTWLDWVPGGQLPELVAQHDICLGIFGDTSKGRSVVPTKVFQGAAAGCAVVTSDTPAQRAVLGDAACFVRPGDPAALAAALRRFTTDHGQVHRLRALARSRAARLFTPEAVTAALVATVTAGPAGTPTAPDLSGNGGVR